MDSQLFIFLQGIFVGIVIGSVYTVYKLQQELKRAMVEVLSNIDKTQIDENSKLDTEFPNLFTEESNNSILLFDKDSDTFICQAKSINELATLAKTYKNITLASVQHNGVVIYFVDGKVESNLNKIT